MYMLYIGTGTVYNVQYEHSHSFRSGPSNKLNILWYSKYSYLVYKYLLSIINFILSIVLHAMYCSVCDFTRKRVLKMSSQQFKSCVLITIHKFLRHPVSRRAQFSTARSSRVRRPVEYEEQSSQAFNSQNSSLSHGGTSKSQGAGGGDGAATVLGGRRRRLGGLVDRGWVGLRSGRAGLARVGRRGARLLLRCDRRLPPREPLDEANDA